MTLLEKSATYQAQLMQMCQTLSRSRIVQQNAHGLLSGAAQMLQALYAYQHRRGDYRLALDPNWSVQIDDQLQFGVPGHAELHFGGEIIFKNQCLQRQVLTVVILFRADDHAEPIVGRPRLIEGENHVVRRFHFDFDPSVADQNRPLAHLQFGGNLNRTYLSIPDTSPCRYELFHQLECPRLPWSITDLTIVLDIFLRQFPAGLDGLIGGSAWRELVMDSEQLWLKDFFQQAAAMMDSTNGRVPLYEYCCEPSTFDN